VLEEYRRKGITQNLTLTAIDMIRLEHPITNLFVWPFSDEGDKSAQRIADICGLPLVKRISGSK
jgi:hypothetical protein